MSDQRPEGKGNAKGAGRKRASKPGVPPGPKGIDDALQAKVEPKVLRGDEAEAAVADAARRSREADPPAAEPGRQVLVLITPHESDVAEQVRRALAPDDRLFQRGGVAVRVVLPGPDAPEGARGLAVRWPRGVAYLMAASSAFVRERIAARCYLAASRTHNGEEVQVHRHVPDWLPGMILADPGPVRRVHGVLSGPTLDGDGRLINSEGYDDATGWFLAAPLPGLEVPESPTRENAAAAAEVLGELVADFDFHTEGDRSRYVCLLLAACCRHLMEKTPLGLITANKPGAGKSRLAELISIVAHGSDSPALMTWPEGSEYQGRGDEVGKGLANLLSRGASLAVIDNLPRGESFGSPVLDAFLTSTAFTARKLGSNDGQLAGGPNFCLLLATGNNVNPVGDTADRTLKVHLQTDHPNPRSRPPEGFRIPELLEHAKAHRARYLGAALTVWRAWMAAGAPRPEGETWGSFEDFANKAVAAVRWVGWPDPIAGRARRVYEMDDEAQSLAALLTAWRPALGDEPVTCSDILRAMARDPEQMSDEGAQAARAFKEAVYRFGGWRKEPSPQGLGKKLKSFGRGTADVEVGGRPARLALVAVEDSHSKTHVYRVEEVPAHPAAPPPAAGIAGFAGELPPGVGNGAGVGARADAPSARDEWGTL